MINQYPVLHRNTWHGGLYDYTLTISGCVQVHLTPGQVSSLGKQIAEDARELSAEDIDEILAALDDTRAKANR